MLEAAKRPETISFHHLQKADHSRVKQVLVIDAKIAGQEVLGPPHERELAPVVDLMAALQSSLAAWKKPPGAAEPAETLTAIAAGGTRCRARAR